MMTKKQDFDSKSLLFKGITFAINLIAVLLLYFISTVVVKSFVGELSWIPLVAAVVAYVFLTKYIKKLVGFIASKINKN